VRARALGRRPWGRNSLLFAVILNVFLSRNLDQNMLKMRIFWEKTVKIVSASASLLLPPTITTLSSSFLLGNAFYPAQKKKQVTLLCFFRTFSSIF